MQAIFYDFIKQRDSTSNPSSTSAPVKATMDVVMKYSTSIISPSIIVDMSAVGGQTTPVAWNYCSLPDFKRYYFVKDWIAVTNDLWELQLEVDIMGNYRPYILQAELFVERSAHLYDRSIPDKMCLGVASTRTTSTFIDGWKAPEPSERGSAIIQVLGNGAGAYLYQIDYIMLQQFSINLFADAYVAGLGAFAELYPELAMSFNPLDYLLSVRAYPFTFSGRTTVDKISVGPADVEIPATIIPAGNYWATTQSVVVPGSTTGVPFLNMSPYMECSVSWPPFPEIPIDPNALLQSRETEENDRTINLNVKVDPATGSGTLRVYNFDNTCLLGSASAPIGVDMPLTQSYTIPYTDLNAISDGIGIVGDILTGNAGGAFQDLGSSVERMIGSNVPHMRTTGNAGGWEPFYTTAHVYTKHQNVIFPERKFVGWPLYKMVPMEEVYGGFVKCINAEIDAKLGSPFSREEADRCTQIMNAGFFLL